MKVRPEGEQRPEKYKDFLKKNPLAKIVILVDTHSTQEFEDNIHAFTKVKVATFHHIVTSVVRGDE